MFYYLCVREQEEAARKKKAAATPAEAPKVYRSGVGKYIPQKPASRYHKIYSLIMYFSRTISIECLLTISIHCQAGGWWEKRKLSTRGFTSVRAKLNSYTCIRRNAWKPLINEEFCLSLIWKILIIYLILVFKRHSIFLDVFPCN